MSKSDAWSAVLSIAEEQWGLVTKQQVEATGVAWSTLARQVRNGTLERVARGVYRVRGAGSVEHLELRAAWLQLNPSVPAWERAPSDGAVSHRSAAALYGIGHLAADTHEFTLPERKQTRRDDVRLHRGIVEDSDWITLHGLPVTRPHRIAADLLAEREDPGAVGQMIADALRSTFDYPSAVRSAIAPFAAAHGLRRDDGPGLLRWLIDLTGDSERDAWLAEAASTDPELGERASAEGVA
jgi:predicted transcriptional regulator of viral defense system